MDFHVIGPHGSELIMQLVGGQLIIVQPDFVGRSENVPSIYAGSSTNDLPTNSHEPVGKSDS